MMNDVDWMSLGKAAVAIVGLGVAAAAFGAGAPLFLTGAAVMMALAVSSMALAAGISLLANVPDPSAALISIVGAIVGVGEAIQNNVGAFAVGVLGISALGVALMPFALAVMLAGTGAMALALGLNMISSIDSGELASIAGVLMWFVPLMGLLSTMTPLLILIGVGFTALGVGAIALGTGMLMAGIGAAMLTGTLTKITQLNPEQLMGSADGIRAVAGALAMLGGSGVVGAFGNLAQTLTGGKNPLDQLVKLGGSARDIVEMGNTLNGLGDTIEHVNAAISTLDGQLFMEQMSFMSLGLREVKKELDEISMFDVIKMRMFGPPETASPTQMEQPQVDMAAQTTATNQVASPQQISESVASESNDSLVRLLNEKLDSVVTLLERGNTLSNDQIRELRDLNNAML
jgi:hypothetical protein